MHICLHCVDRLLDVYVETVIVILEPEAATKFI